VTSKTTLNEEQLGPYYHGTNEEFKPGDILRGPGQGGAMTFNPPNESYSPEHVYYTTSRSGAEGFAWAAAHRRKTGTPRVYEVEPHDGEKDPETAGMKGGWDVAYRSPSATVLREIEYRES
jgi:hypothetical protein